MRPRRIWHALWPVLALILGAIACTDAPEEPSASTASAPVSTGSTVGEATGPPMQQPRAVHRASTLRDGRVLFTGGCSRHGCAGPAAATTELFDPATTAITSGPKLREGRISHTATLLSDGRVLVAGGYPGEGMAPTGSIEVFDPSSDEMQSFGQLGVGRADHTATSLPDGRVLVAGGRDGNGEPLRSVEVISVDGSVRSGPPLATPRTAHTATAVGSHVLLIGGTAQDDTALATTESFDPSANRWGDGPSLLRARVKHASVALPDGRLLVVGGASGTDTRDRFADTELLRAGSSRFERGPTLADGRYKLTDAVVSLPDGRIVIAGGPTVDIIDVDAGTVDQVDSAALDGRRAFQTVNLVSDTQVLVAGGYDDTIEPTSSTWLATIG